MSHVTQAPLSKTKGAGGGHIEAAIRTACYYCCPRVFVMLALMQPKKVTRWGDRSTTAGKLQLDHES